MSGLNLRQLIEALEALEAVGEKCLPCMGGLVRLAYGDRAGDEFDARERIVRRIVQAKREAGFPVICDFFDVVWPEALSALKEKQRS